MVGQGGRVRGSRGTSLGSRPSCPLGVSATLQPRSESDRTDLRQDQAIAQITRMPNTRRTLTGEEVVLFTLASTPDFRKKESR